MTRPRTAERPRPRTHEHPAGHRTERNAARNAARDAERDTERTAARTARALDAANFDEDEAEMRPRRGAKRTVLHAIRQIPHYLRLLFGLMGDVRVSSLDKLLVAGAIAYTLSPIDFVPDYIPFLGQVDDIFLIVTAAQRLIANAGRRIVRGHWTGDLRELADLNLKATLAAAAFFLPGGLRRRLRRLGRGKGRWPF